MTREAPCQYVPGGKIKRVLYVGSGLDCFESLVSDMERVPGAERLQAELYPLFRYGGAEIEWVPVWDTLGATGALRSAYVNLVVIDLRWQENFDARLGEVRGLLKELD
ncbi:MAG: hypothetical protein OES69_19095, partial [Myxococcales bacterium]|nr:hypothetical protein [Myxococcales bacterium]